MVCCAWCNRLCSCFDRAKLADVLEAAGSTSQGSVSPGICSAGAVVPCITPALLSVGGFTSEVIRAGALSRLLKTDSWHRKLAGCGHAAVTAAWSVERLQRNAASYGHQRPTAGVKRSETGRHAAAASRGAVHNCADDRRAVRRGMATAHTPPGSGGPQIASAGRR